MKYIFTGGSLWKMMNDNVILLANTGLISYCFTQ